MDINGLQRREVLIAGAMAGGAMALVGCSTSGDGAADAPEGTAPGEVLADTAEVPVGGGVVNQSARVVVTQPSEGEYRAFSAVCPHQGCLVANVLDEQIICPCHDSRFSAGDGAVLQGPATTGLAEIAVTVEGTDIVQA